MYTVFNEVTEINFYIAKRLSQNGTAFLKIVGNTPTYKVLIGLVVDELVLFIPAVKLSDFCTNNF